MSGFKYDKADLLWEAVRRNQKYKLFCKVANNKKKISYDEKKYLHHKWNLKKIL